MTIPWRWVNSITTIGQLRSYSLWQFTKTIERRKQTHPDRPLIRISSTFFYHLSSDYDLVPISSLASRAKILRAEAVNLGTVMEEPEYAPMKVGQQVQKYVHPSFPAFLVLMVFPFSELRHIALMAWRKIISGNTASNYRDFVLLNSDRLYKPNYFVIDWYTSTGSGGP